MKADVSTLRFQCPKCNVPADVVEFVGREGNAAILDVEPCGDRVHMEIESWSFE